MCDTFDYRSQDKDAQSRIWFGKNSDREPNEAHEVRFIKGRLHPAESRIKCTYIEVPQVNETYDVILCKPVWMWGAEMGVNSKGVAIGNEALFTKGGAPREPALTGMDFLRLALERSSSSRQAVEIITQLLRENGQGGNCGYSHPFFYNNSFLATDRNESWVLETVGRDWAARRYVTSTAISNGLTIQDDWDEVSPGFSNLKNLQDEKSDWLFTTFSQSRRRRSCVMSTIRHIKSNDGIQAAFRVLRSHNGSDEIPASSLSDNTVCMHAGFGPIRLDQTTGSLVVDMSSPEMTIWFTGTSAPCLSVFQPVKISDFNEDYVISTEADWCDNEFLHRNMIFCKQEFIDAFQTERDRLESRFSKTMNEKEDTDRLPARTKKIFLSEWREKAENETKRPGLFLYRTAWRSFNKKANLQVDI